MLKQNEDKASVFGSASARPPEADLERALIEIRRILEMAEAISFVSTYNNSIGSKPCGEPSSLIVAAPLMLSDTAKARGLADPTRSP